MTIEQYPSSNNIASTVIWKYTGQGTELVLSGTDSYGQVLNFTPGSEQLFLNGVLLVRTQDYTPAANGLSITLPSSLAYGDFVQIYCYSNYSISTVASSAITGAVQNTQLANSTITIGNQAIALGQTITIPTGLILSGSTNTFSNIPNSALSNSNIIINGVPTPLGGTINITTPNTILSQKGGLIVGTGGGSVVQLTPGVDGTIPLADSTQTAGINWSGPHNLAGKNLILNGGFDSWSLGTSFTTDLSYTADRWYSRIIGAQSITQETSDLPSTNTRYGLKWNTTASTSGFCQIHYPLDSATIINLRGKVLTFSFYAKVSGGYAGNIGPEIKYSNSIVDAGYINGATAVTVSSGGYAAPTTWTRLSYTFTVPLDAVSLYVGIAPDTSQSISGQTVRIANVQLEVGPTATNFTKAFSTPNADTVVSGPSGFDGILVSSTPTTANAQGNPPKLSWAGYNVASKNMIINGAMEFDQRFAGTSVVATDGGYTLDRVFSSISQSSKATHQQVADAPSGFSNSLKITMTTGFASLGVSDYVGWLQFLEGVNIAQVGLGTSTCKPMTISFWVKSSLIGTYAVAIKSVADYAYVAPYSITSANTWTKIIITVPPTTVGTFPIGNTSGLMVYFPLSMGTTYQVSTPNTWVSNSNAYNLSTATNTFATTTGATWQITGIQLEVGTIATQFTRAGGDFIGELQKCQRYFEKSYDLYTAVGATSSNGIIYQIGATDGNNNAVYNIRHKVEKRNSSYSIVAYTAAGLINNWQYQRSGVGLTNVAVTSDQYSTSGARLYLAAGAAWTPTLIQGHWAVNNEL